MKQSTHMQIRSIEDSEKTNNLMRWFKPEPKNMEQATSHAKEDKILAQWSESRTSAIDITIEITTSSTTTRNLQLRRIFMGFPLAFITLPDSREYEIRCPCCVNWTVHNTSLVPQQPRLRHIFSRSHTITTYWAPVASGHRGVAGAWYRHHPKND